MFNAQLPWQLKKLSYTETGWISDSKLDKASHAKHPFFLLSCLLCFTGWHVDREPEQGEVGACQRFRAYAFCICFSQSRFLYEYLVSTECLGGNCCSPCRGSSHMALPFPDEPSAGFHILAAGSRRPPCPWLTHSGPLSTSPSPWPHAAFFFNPAFSHAVNYA